MKDRERERFRKKIENVERPYFDQMSKNLISTNPLEVRNSRCPALSDKSCDFCGRFRVLVAFYCGISAWSSSDWSQICQEDGGKTAPIFVRIRASQNGSVDWWAGWGRRKIADIPALIRASALWGHQVTFEAERAQQTSLAVFVFWESYLKVTNFACRDCVCLIFICFLM